MTVVNSITQENIPLAEINKPVKINFVFDTDGQPEIPNARIEAMVIADGIITDMSHSPPSGSVFEQSEDKKQASVISISENSTSGWARNRTITLQFSSLPYGKQDYIVGTLYYYNAENIIGLGIPLSVKIDNDIVYPVLLGTNDVFCKGTMSLNAFLQGMSFISGHTYKIIFSSEPVSMRILSCPEQMSFNHEGGYCDLTHPSNIEFYDEDIGSFKVLASGSAENLYSNRYFLFYTSNGEYIKAEVWDYGSTDRYI